MSDKGICRTSGKIEENIYNTTKITHRGCFPLGANLVLLDLADEYDIAGMVATRKDCVEDWFDEIVAWNPHIVDNEHLVWMKLYGFPVHVWMDEFFKF